MRVKILFVFLAGLCLHHGPAMAREQSINPGINSHYKDPDYQHWVDVFESPQREIYIFRKAIINSLKLKPAMHVADIGAGTGFLSFMMAQKVGEQGKVYAVDIAKNFIDNLQQRARQQGLMQIVGVVNEPGSTGLAADSIDLALICDTYHHFEYPGSMMASLHQALRPGGALIIIDFRKIPGLSTNWVMHHVRANQQQVMDEIHASGFELVAEENILSDNYFLRFKKIPQADNEK